MNNRLVSILAGILIVVPALALVAPPGEAATTRFLAITGAVAKPTVAFQGFDGNPPKVFDFNGDGQLEIVAQNDNQWVYVFDSKTGAILFEAKTKFPTSWGARSFNGPEVAIMQNGGKPRLIVENSAAYVTAYEFDPFASTSTKFAMTKLWERRLNDCHANPGSDSKPTLADLDKDGDLEILLGTEQMGVYALKMDGTLYWKNCLGGGNAEPSVGDLNSDGFLDVVHVSDGGVVAALNGRTGSWMWGFNVLSKYALGSASMPVGAAIAQIDGVGGLDVVVGVRDSHDASNFNNNHAMLLALNSGGGVIWAKQDPTGNPLTYTHPIVVDADKDGKNEIYWGDWNTMGHKPPWDPALAWQRTGPANFYRFDTQGNQVWKVSLDTYWSNKDLALADVDADGVQEVLANGPSGGDGIWYINSKTGAKENFVSLHPWQAARGPVVADLWNTGKMQWVIEVGPATSTAGGPAVLVYDTGVAYNSMWPHLPYTTLSGGGTPPPPPPPPPPLPTTSPPTGTFSASFSLSPNVNEWWVEVGVTGNQAISGVTASVNGGAPVALTKQSWGAWAKSFFVARGSSVVFKATASTGQVATSQTFTWLGAAPTFTATFSPKAVGNDWWVEVAVSSASTITKVEASINGGAYQNLDKKSWGNWAKTINAPNGSSVKFRATDSAGATATSSTYTWT